MCSRGISMVWRSEKCGTPAPRHGPAPPPRSLSPQPPLSHARSRLALAANVKAYLYAAVRNESLKYLRHAEVEARSAPELAVAASPVKTPEDERSAKAAAAFVYGAIARLPERRRLIFTMNRFDHLTYAEIAQVLEISIKTVETQMGRALAVLRAELVDSPDE